MRTWLAATAAAVLLAGCGTPAKPVTGQPRAHAVAASAVPLRARALALAWRLVGELSPPPGTRTVHLAKLPPPLNQPQAPPQPGWVRVTNTLEAPAEPLSVWQAMLTRTPLRDLGGLLPGASAGTILPARNLASTWPNLASRYVSSLLARS